MNKRERVKLVFRKLIPLRTILASTMGALLLGELLVRLAVNPNDYLYATLIDDPYLRYRIKPYTTGHDALGFRNLGVPERADVIAIGDSITYGVRVARDKSWPFQLSSLLQEPVYNMALGGYGPLQYLYLVQNQAKKLKPRLLIVGISFGNDLMDSYTLPHVKPYWHDWLGSSASAGGETEYVRAAQSEPKKRFEDLRNWLSRHSVIYSMLRVVVFSRLALLEQDSVASQGSPERQMIWTDPSQPSVRTIFNPQLKHAALDLKASSVREGLSITKRALASIKTEADAQGARLLFVLIPTKERVYCQYLKKSGATIPVTFSSLCDTEQLVKEDLSHFLATKGIGYVDVTDALEEKTREHIQIYPTDSDDHPQAAGQSVIAKAVYAEIHRQHYEKNQVLP